MLAVKQERAIIGNVAVTKKTAVIATEDGIIAVESHSIEDLTRVGNQALPAPRPQPAIQYRQAVDEDHPWYSPHGKGCLALFLLIIFYLVIGTILLPFLIICLPCICIYHFCCNDDNDT